MPTYFGAFTNLAEFFKEAVDCLGLAPPVIVGVSEKNAVINRAVIEKSLLCQ